MKSQQQDRNTTKSNQEKISSKSQKETIDKKTVQRFNTNYGYHYKGKGKVFSKKSITVPDQSLTVRELFENHSRGIPMNAAQHDPQYFETEVPVFQDLTDQEAWNQEQKENIENLQKTVKETEQKIKEQKAKKQKEKEDALYERFKREKQDQLNKTT